MNENIINSENGLNKGVKEVIRILKEIGSENRNISKIIECLESDKYKESKSLKFIKVELYDLKKNINNILNKEEIYGIDNNNNTKEIYLHQLAEILLAVLLQHTGESESEHKEHINNIVKSISKYKKLEGINKFKDLIFEKFIAITNKEHDDDNRTKDVLLGLLKMFRKKSDKINDMIGISAENVKEEDLMSLVVGILDIFKDKEVKKIAKELDINLDEIVIKNNNYFSDKNEFEEFQDKFKDEKIEFKAQNNQSSGKKIKFMSVVIGSVEFQLYKRDKINDHNRYRLEQYKKIIDDIEQIIKSMLSGGIISEDNDNNTKEEIAA